jgi:hypothetical protein
MKRNFLSLLPLFLGQILLATLFSGVAHANIGASPAINDAGQVLYVRSLLDGSGSELVKTDTTNPSVDLAVVSINAHVFSSPVIDADGYVYLATLQTSSESSVYADDSKIIKFDSALNKVWEVNAGSSVYSTVAMTPPVVGSSDVYGGQLFFGTKDGKIISLNSSDGSQNWVVESGFEIGGNAVLWPVNGSLIVANHAGEVLFLDQSTGAVNHIYSHPDRAAIMTPALLADGQVVLATFNGEVIKLNNQGQEVWRYKFGEKFVASPVVDKEGFIYVADYTSGDVISIYDRGLERWRYNSGNAVYASLLLTSADAQDTQGHLVIADLAGNVIQLDKHTGQQVASQNTGADIYAAVNMSSNQIITVNRDANLSIIETTQHLANAQIAKFQIDAQNSGSHVDTDGDGYADAADAFPNDASEWLDTDRDGTGNIADLNDDGDSCDDANDTFPLDGSECLDTDGDLIGDNAEVDDDNDGMLDVWEETYLAGSSKIPMALTADPDTDGLTNEEEFNAGTNPYLADTDGDGITDIVELNSEYCIAYNELSECTELANTDPTQADTDGDELLDGFEVQYGFDPIGLLDPDTNKDPDGDLYDNKWEQDIASNPLLNEFDDTPLEHISSYSVSGRNFTISPNGKHLYTNTPNAEVSYYEIARDGSLTPKLQLDFPFIYQTSASITMGPNGTYLFLKYSVPGAWFPAQKLIRYTRNPDTGELSNELIVSDNTGLVGHTEMHPNGDSIFATANMWGVTGRVFNEDKSEVPTGKLWSTPENIATNDFAISGTGEFLYMANRVDTDTGLSTAAVFRLNTEDYSTVSTHIIDQTEALRFIAPMPGEDGRYQVVHSNNQLSNAYYTDSEFSNTQTFGIISSLSSSEFTGFTYVSDNTGKVFALKNDGSIFSELSLSITANTVMFRPNTLDMYMYSGGELHHIKAGYIGQGHPDFDGDGMKDIWEDQFGFDRLVANDGSLDSDSDGLTDLEEAQANTDPFTVDTDGDGIWDGVDAFPSNSEEQYDTDFDGIGNNSDTDDDNDGVADATDLFPLDGSETADNDLDGIGNNSDLDDDNDGVLDTEDAFPFDLAETLDTDGDGIGNNTDMDDDGDGIADIDDSFPLHDSLDIDEDGMDNEWEIQYGFDPMVAHDEAVDLDEDGLTDVNEYLAQTDPTNADTDGDELLDGFEVKYGFDPIDAVESDATKDPDGDLYDNKWEQDIASNPLLNEFDDAPLEHISSYSVSGRNFTISPNGKHLYTNTPNAEVSYYEIARDGSLTPKLQLDFPFIYQTSASITMGPNGTYLFLKYSVPGAWFPAQKLIRYTRNPDTGELSNELIVSDNTGLVGHTEMHPNGDSIFATANMWGVTGRVFNEDKSEVPTGKLWSTPENIATNDFAISGTGEFLYMANRVDTDTGLSTAAVFRLNTEDYSTVSTHIIDQTEALRFIAPMPGEDGRYQVVHSDNQLSNAYYTDSEFSNTQTFGTISSLSSNEFTGFTYIADNTGKVFALKNDGSIYSEINLANISNTVIFRPDTLDMYMYSSGQLHHIKAGYLGYGHPDTDSDGVRDLDDTFMHDPTEQYDSDGDGMGNNADAFPYDETEQYDTDLDGIGNNADTDDDGDNVLDVNDAFPLDVSEWLDTDSDGTGNNTDLDDDNDGMSDVYEEGNGLDTLDATDRDLDLDGDGLSNYEESELGTLANNTDSDGDSIPDGWEVTYGLDPTLAADGLEDWDSDGHSNAAEYVVNTSPLDPRWYPGAPGLRKWGFDSGDKVRSSMAFGHDGQAYFINESDILFAIDSSGDEIWQFDTAAEVVSSPAIGLEGEIYYTDLNGDLTAVATNGDELWTFTVGMPIESSPVVGDNGVVFFGSDDGVMYAVDSGGSEIWTYETNGAIKSSPRIDREGVVHFGSDDGSVYAVHSESGMEYRL